MVLFASLRRTRRLAGVVGYSGRMVGMETTSDEIKSRPPVLVIHGDSAELIPPDAMLEAAQNVASSAVVVQWHICPNLGHGIDQSGLDIGGHFLRDCFTGVA